MLHNSLSCFFLAFAILTHINLNHANLLYLVFRKDSVLFFYCHCQEKRGNLKDQRNKEEAYISKGFSNWKKRQNVFIAIKNPLVIKHHQCITWYFLTVVMLGT